MKVKCPACLEVFVAVAEGSLALVPAHDREVGHVHGYQNIVRAWVPCPGSDKRAKVISSA